MPTYIDAGDQQSTMPIFAMVHNEKMEVLKLLLDRGADVNVRCITGAMLLRIAAEAGNTEIVSLW